MKDGYRVWADEDGTIQTNMPLKQHVDVLLDKDGLPIGWRNCGDTDFVSMADGSRWEMKEKPIKWAVEWRGKITRDIGVDYVEAGSMIDAKQQFQAAYPMREIKAVTRMT